LAISHVWVNLPFRFSADIFWARLSGSSAWKISWTMCKSLGSAYAIDTGRTFHWWMYQTRWDINQLKHHDEGPVFLIVFPNVVKTHFQTFAHQEVELALTVPVKDPCHLTSPLKAMKHFFANHTKQEVTKSRLHSGLKIYPNGPYYS